MPNLIITRQPGEALVLQDTRTRKTFRLTLEGVEEASRVFTAQLFVETESGFQPHRRISGRDGVTYTFADGARITLMRHPEMGRRCRVGIEAPLSVKVLKAELALRR
jgi:sRNA-binding carbon storage regulator CsrA